MVFVLLTIYVNFNTYYSQFRKEKEIESDKKDEKYLYNF